MLHEAIAVLNLIAAPVQCHHDGYVVALGAVAAWSAGRCALGERAVRQWGLPRAVGLGCRNDGA